MTKTGTLVLIVQYKVPIKKGDLYLEEHFTKYSVAFTDFKADTAIFPIIVCDDEIKEDSEVYSYEAKSILTVGTVVKNSVWFQETPGEYKLNKCRKVLVDTPQIPQNVIDAILSGELKDGSQVEVKLTHGSDNPFINVFTQKAGVTWNKEAKQSPLYTEEEIVQLISEYDLITQTMSMGDYIDKTPIERAKIFFEQHKKK
jgi:hypothetical protein